MNSWADRRFVESVAEYILRSVLENSGGVLKFSGYDLPLPPTDTGKLSSLFGSFLV